MVCTKQNEKFEIGWAKNKLNVKKTKQKRAAIFSHVSTVLIEWHMHLVLLVQARCLLPETHYCLHGVLKCNNKMKQPLRLP